nr:mucolipin-3-like [Dermacentor andersoni]
MTAVFMDGGYHDSSIEDLPPGGSSVTDGFDEKLSRYLERYSLGSSINVSGECDSVASHVDPSETCARDGVHEELTRRPHAMERYMRLKLQRFFMNPLEKWRHRGRFPWKLTLQIFKLVVVTAQVILFGLESANFQRQHRNTYMALEHILLNGWDTSRDVLIYPPPAGPYVVETKDKFYQHIRNVVVRYSSITTDPVGTFEYASPDGSLQPAIYCETTYKDGRVWPFNSTLSFDSETVTNCTNITSRTPGGDWEDFDLVKFLGRQVSFDELIKARISFSLKALYLTNTDGARFSECYEYHLSVVYDNSKHDGVIAIQMHLSPSCAQCRKSAPSMVPPMAYTLHQCLNVLIIVTCALSTLLCIRSLYKGHKLMRKTSAYFTEYLCRELSWSDKIDFIDFWFMMIIVDDVLLVAGSAVKIRIEERLVPSLMYTVCSLLLGCGCLLCWCGLLRYVGYFRVYNVLILTLKKSVPNVIRFLLCTMLLFCGYVVCGWVVIGPHHIKFRTVSTAAECLFSIINGDDIFATFAMLFEGNDQIIWYFAQAYMYSFVILFVYVVVSLFVAIFVDAYETIRDAQAKNDQPSAMWVFIAESSDEPTSSAYRSDDELEKLWPLSRELS